jgi:basic membrane lipoprotein Med (substrate-binding protein (PBP1-ABC) superfamily)
MKATAASLLAGAASTRLAYAADTTIGIVYVGPRDDYGWNQAHAVAAKALKSLPGVKVVEEENVPETDACAKTMESMINLDGAKIVLGTSFGYYSPFMVDIAKKYPAVQLRHAAPLWTPKDPKNLGSYFGYLNQAHYVDGVAAGLSTKSNKLGFVAAKPISSVLSNINSFMLGAKSTNPKAIVQVIFTGDWSLPVREAEAANALVDAGCDVVTCHVDGPKVARRPAATIRRRRRWRRRALSPAPSTSGSRSTRAMRPISPAASRSRTWSAAVTKPTWYKTRRSAPAARLKAKPQLWRRSPRSRPRSRSTPRASRTTKARS